MSSHIENPHALETAIKNPANVPLPPEDNRRPKLYRRRKPMKLSHEEQQRWDRQSEKMIEEYLKKNQPQSCPVMWARGAINAANIPSLD